MLDRTIAPPFKKTIAISLPAPSEINLSDRHKLYFLSGLKQQIVKIEVIFNAGKWAEPRPGISHFTSMMLEKGTTKKNSVEIAGVLDRFGANLEINAGFDFVSVSLYSLKNKIENVFPLFIEVLKDPSFHEQEWDQMLDIFLQNLKVNNEKTGYVAGKIIRKNIFGDHHPYGSSVEEADANAITTTDLKRFFSAMFTVHSVYVLGDLSDSQIGYIETGVRSLPLGDQSKVLIPSNSSAPYAWRSDKEGRLQSTIRVGKRSVLRNDPEYADVLLTTHLLGGFFGSRLMKNIREEKGLTYGISASVNTFRNDSLFVIGADVNKENAGLALTEIRKELENLMNVPVGDQELNLAKNHFIGSLQTDMANLFSVEEKLKNIHLNSLSSNYYEELLSRIDQITADKVMKTATKYLAIDTLFEVVVG